MLLGILVARYSHLNGRFWIFVPKFWEVVGTYEWCFVILCMQLQCWGYHEVVGTLKPYHMQNIFFALTDRRDTKEHKIHHCGTFTIFKHFSEGKLKILVQVCFVLTYLLVDWAERLNSSPLLAIIGKHMRMF